MAGQDRKTDELFQAGKAAALAGDIVSARHLLMPYFADGSQHPATYFLAKVEYEKGDMSEARLLVDSFLAENPKHVAANVLLGQMHIDADEAELALKHFEIALQTRAESLRAQRGRDEAKAMIQQVNAAHLIEVIDTRYRARPGRKPTAEVVEAARELMTIPPRPNWNNDVMQAKIGYFHFASSLESALLNYDPDLLETSVELDYLTWPKRIQEFIRGRSVLDVGCGFGGYGTGFLAGGASSYVGLDPVMDLDSKRAKNKRERVWSTMPMTPNEIQARFPDIRLFQGTSEDLSFDETFDTISLHNVTEHLIQLDLVFEGLVPVCHSGTEIIFLHHNYYCWNGHHMTPHHPRLLVEDDPEQQKYYDWAHIPFVETAPEDHYVLNYLNRVTLDEIRAITEKHFRIERWDEINSQPVILERLTPEIQENIAKIRPDLTERDLKVNAVFCVARPKG